MQPLTIYGIPSCDTCRKARQWLDDNGIEHRFHDLRNDGLDIQMLERWAAALGWRQILNTRSLTWRRIPENDRRDLSQNRAFVLMLEQPTLVKRPVFERGGTVAVGFTADSYAKLVARD